MDSDTATTTSSLLRQLRGCGSGPRIDCEKSLQLLIQHQSEFPSQIREAIPAEADKLLEARIVMSQIAEIVKSFFFLGQPEYNKDGTKEEAVTTIGGGLDYQVDTEEEVELTIRFFPFVLHMAVWIDDKICNLVAWATTHLKSLPFVPLMVELENEAKDWNEKMTYYEFLWEGKQSNVMPLQELITNKCLLKQEPQRYEDEEDFHRRVDETCVSVLVCLKEKDLIPNREISNCMGGLLGSPSSLTKKRLRLLIKWDCKMLAPLAHRGSVLDRFLNRCCYSTDQCHNLHSIDDKLERFRDIVELSMSHYPHQFGFLFFSRPTIKDAYKMFGKKKVTTMVNECIQKWIHGRNGDAIRDLVFVTASHYITLDVVYFLLRQDPTAWMPATRNGI